MCCSARTIAVSLYKNTRDTPTVLAELAASADIGGALAQSDVMRDSTAFKHKTRINSSDTPQRLQTTLTLVLKAFVVQLRRLFLPFDKLLALYSKARLLNGSCLIVAFVAISQRDDAAHSFA